MTKYNICKNFTIARLRGHTWRHPTLKSWNRDDEFCRQCFDWVMINVNKRTKVGFFGFHDYDQWFLKMGVYEVDFDELADEVDEAEILEREDFDY